MKSLCSLLGGAVLFAATVACSDVNVPPLPEDDDDDDGRDPDLPAFTWTADLPSPPHGVIFIA